MARPDQVDAKVPRGKAGFHSILPAVGFAIGAPWPLAGKILIAFTAVAMSLSVLGGPRWSLFGRLYNEVIRPAFNIAPGRREAAAPHRFAETIGAAFLIGATAFFLLGAPALGWALALIVAALAAVNWLAGICVGCQMYVLARRVGARTNSRTN